MSKKMGELSSNMLATKGMAAPSPDMPGRVATVMSTPVAPAAAPAAAETAQPPVQSPDKTSEEQSTLNFTVPVSFKREFRRYAADNDLKLIELLYRSFDAYKQQSG